MDAFHQTTFFISLGVTQDGQGVTFLVVFPSFLCHCLFYPSLCGSSIICWAKASYSVTSSSEEIAVYKGVDSVCPWKEVISGSSYANILDNLPGALFINVVM